MRLSASTRLWFTNDPERGHGMRRADTKLHPERYRPHTAGANEERVAGDRTEEV